MQETQQQAGGVEQTDEEAGTLYNILYTQLREQLV